MFGYRDIWCYLFFLKLKKNVKGIIIVIGKIIIVGVFE